MATFAACFFVVLSAAEEGRRPSLDLLAALAPLVAVGLAADEEVAGLAVGLPAGRAFGFTPAERSATAGCTRASCSRCLRPVSCRSRCFSAAARSSRGSSDGPESAGVRST